MMPDTFCAFILTHGRPHNVITYRSLKKFGYTGRIVFVVDDGDKSLETYRERFGAENVAVFSKAEVQKTIDMHDNRPETSPSIVYARNACFDIAERMGIETFIQLDDDYTWFGHRVPAKAFPTRRMDEMLMHLIKFMECSGSITTVAFSQGGDLLGGYREEVILPRKAMNSFICKTSRRFVFTGRINEDVNTYVSLGATGSLFFTIPQIQLLQKITQKNSGGMTDIYRAHGTYVKSFYTVMRNPACVKVKPMGEKHFRLHHSVLWNNAVPKIIHEKYRKA